MKLNIVTILENKNTRKFKTNFNTFCFHLWQEWRENISIASGDIGPGFLRSLDTTNSLVMALHASSRQMRTKPSELVPGSQPPLKEINVSANTIKNIIS